MERKYLLCFIIPLIIGGIIIGWAYWFSLTHEYPTYQISTDPCPYTDPHYTDCIQEIRFDRQFGENRSTAIGPENMWGESIAAGLAIAGAGGIAVARKRLKKR